MFLSKLKVVVGAIMLVVVLVGGGVAISLGQPSDSPKPKKADPEPKQAKAKEDAAKAMLKRLEGTWELVSAHANGERSPTAVVFHRIKGDTWEATTREGKVIETGTYKLVDLDASPKRIDSIEDKDVPGRNDRTLNGIFTLDGDSLIMCFGAVARPKGFFTERGDGCIATQFERVVTTSAAPDKAGPKKDQTPKKNLEGVWAVISVKDNDKKMLESEPIFSHAAGTQAPIRNARLTLQGETFTLKTGLVSLEGTYAFDPSVMPKEITLSITTDSGGLLSIPGVYTLDRDKLTITFGKLPASVLASLAGKEPGVCYTLRREPLPKKDADNPK